MKKMLFIYFFMLLSVLGLSAQFTNSFEIPEVEVLLEVIPAEINSGDSFTIYATYKIPENYHMFFNEDLFTINLKNLDGFILKETRYPMNETETLLGLPAFSGIVTISREIEVPEDFKTGDILLNISADYQICEDDGTCLLPDSVQFEQKITIKGDPKSHSSTNVFTILKYIILAFIGGLILNVMPCVLPLLSVKALNLIEQSSHEKKTIKKSSLMYGSGILVSFLILAFTVIILKSSGELLGWGFQFQNPIFVLSLITVIFIFSLSLFDVYSINPPQQGMKKAQIYSVGKSYSGSFITGIFAVLVATPCTAPFMGAALGFAFTQPPLVIILIFTSLSLGFALPFIMLGFYPALMKKIPKPGSWMNTFKEFMGFLMLGTVVYMLASLHSLIGESIKGVLWFLLFAGLATWIYGKFGSAIERKSRRIVAVLIALIVIISSGFLFLDLNKNEIIQVEKNDIWEVFSTELVNEYRSDNKTVFIDFYADWCTSCKVNDAAVLNRDKMLRLFKDYDVQLLKGDFTAGDREIAQWLSNYKRAGVPLYILFRPGEEGIVFPEFLTISMVEKELKKIKP